MPLPNLDNLKRAANSAGAVLVRAWFARNGPELTRQIIAGQFAQAQSLLWRICEQYPAAAGAIAVVMNGTADEVIENIAVFDGSLAAQLRPHRDVLDAFLIEWRSKHAE